MPWKEPRIERENYKYTNILSFTIEATTTLSIQIFINYLVPSYILAARNALGEYHYFI